jgi:hypothetical protein
MLKTSKTQQIKKLKSDLLKFERSLKETQFIQEGLFTTVDQGYLYSELIQEKRQCKNIIDELKAKINMLMGRNS